MSEDLRTPTEMLMESLADVEEAEHVIIIMQKGTSLSWDAAMPDRNPEINDVQLLLQRTQTAITLETFGLFKEKE